MDKEEKTKEESKAQNMELKYISQLKPIDLGAPSTSIKATLTKGLIGASLSGETFVAATLS